MPGRERRFLHRPLLPSEAGRGSQASRPQSAFPGSGVAGTKSGAEGLGAPGLPARAGSPRGRRALEKASGGRRPDREGALERSSERPAPTPGASRPSARPPQLTPCLRTPIHPVPLSGSAQRQCRSRRAVRVWGQARVPLRSPLRPQREDRFPLPPGSVPALVPARRSA